MPKTSLTDLSEMVLEHNKAAQYRNNQARVKALRRHSTREFVRVFDQVPESLHFNDPEIVGYVPDSETPHGLRGFDRQLWRLPEDRDSGLKPAAQPVLEALFIIGSSGTVGCNPDSDLDYWVCYEDGAFTPRGFELFQLKLAALKEWAVRECGVETNLYCINLADLARGRITHLEDAETEGEVAPILLLEEFYRTFLLVAGKMPLWPVLPPDLPPDRYEEAAAVLARGERAEFLDLGFLALPEPQQILAAALWLAHKSEADPFKALAKLTALLEYVEKDFKCPPLCAEVKAAVLAASETDRLVDPYVVTIERVTDFGLSSLSPVHLELLRSATVIKVLGATADRPADRLPPTSAKLRILEKWLHRWGWPLKRLEHFADYCLWSERSRLELSQEILKALVRLYIRISNHLTKNYAHEIDAQKKELAPFAARLLTRHAGLETTLESLPSQRHHSLLEGRLVLRPEPASRAWTLHTLTREGEAPGPDNLIYASPRAARAAAWLVHNQFSHSQIEGLEVLPAPDGRIVRLGDLPGLLVELAALFPPFDFSLEGAVWAARATGLTLLVLNFEEVRDHDDGTILAVDLITRTGWGEMRHEHLSLDQEDSRPDRYLKIARLILKGGVIQPKDLVFHVQDSFSHEARLVVVNIRGALTATINRQQTSSTHDARHLRIDQDP